MTAAKKARSSTRRTNASTKPIAKTAGGSSVKSSAISTARRSPPADAIELLTRDHREAKHMFEAYEQLVQAGADADERQALAQEICEFLTLHATIEEELLYPPAREALTDEADLIDEATVEHASAKDLIAQIEASSPEEALYDAKVKVLGEYIQHHVKEEEGEMFPQIKKAGLDLVSLGDEMTRRREELQSSFAP